MAAHRYWRVLITAKNGSAAYGLSCGELELRESVGGADATGSGTASAYATNNGYVAANAFANDGTTTLWSAGSTTMPGWLKYDFGVGVTKDIVELAWTAPNNGDWGILEAPKELEVQYSDDNSTWTAAWCVSGQTSWTAGQQRIFSKPGASGAYRYWRLYYRSSGSTVTVASEVELRGSVGGSDLTGSGTPSASSILNTSYPASNAFDNNTATFWCTSSPAAFPGQWLAYDFGSGTTHDVIEVAYRIRTDSNPEQGPTAFDVQYSSDAQAWGIKWAVTGQTGWTTGEQRIFTGPLPENHAPTAPGAFTTPATDTYDTSVSYSHGAATDEDSDPIEYEVRSWDGADETVVRALDSTTSDTLDTTSWVNGDYTLRAYAHDGIEYSATYAESATFTIDHPISARANQIFIEALVGGVSRRINQIWFEAALKLSNDPPTAPGAFTTPAADTYDLSVAYSHGAATDPQSDPIRYEVRRWDGASETVVRALGSTTSDTLDTTYWDDGEYTLRAYAHDGALYSETYAESATITIFHVAWGTLNQVFVEALVAGRSGRINQIWLEALAPSTLPAVPSLSLAVDSISQITATITAGVGVHTDDFDLYVSTTSPVALDGDHLYAASLGATPDPVAITGLAGGTTYYVVALASNENGSTASAEESATTLGAGTAPVLRVGSITANSATLATNDARGVLEVLYWTALSTDTDWSPLVETFSDTTVATYFSHTVSSLTTTAYRAQARFRYVDGWSDWSNTVVWTCAAPPSEASLVFYGFTAPHFGECVAGTVNVSWTNLGEGHTYTFSISADLGATWTELATGLTTNSTTFDSTDYTDGIDFCLEIVDDDWDSESGKPQALVLGALKIDNGGSLGQSYWYMGAAASERAFDHDTFTTIWQQSSPVAGFSAWYGPIDSYGIRSPMGSYEGTLADTTLPPGRYWDVTTDAWIGGQNGGGAFPTHGWAAAIDQELSFIGVVVAANGTYLGGNQDGVAAGIGSAIGSPYGDCNERMTYDANLEIHRWWNGTPGAQGSVALGRMRGWAIKSYWYMFACPRDQIYRIRARLLPDGVDPTKCWLRVRIEGPQITAPGLGATYWTYEEQYTWVPNCGYPGVARVHVANSGDGLDGGFARYQSIGATLLYVPGVDDPNLACGPRPRPPARRPKIILPLPPKWYDPEDERQTRFLVGQALLARGSRIPLPTPSFRGYDRVNEAAFRLAVAQALPDVDLSPFANPAASYDQHSEGDLRHRLEQIL